MGSLRRDPEALRGRVAHYHHRSSLRDWKVIIVRRRPLMLGAERQQMRGEVTGSEMGNIQQLSRSYTHTQTHTQVHAHTGTHTHTQVHT